MESGWRVVGEHQAM